MRKRLLIALMAFLPIMAFAQGAGGQVRRPVKKQQTTNTTPPQKKQTPKKDQSSKDNDQKPEKRQEQKPVEAAGYDVSFNCNVPSATLYIDGNNNGTASGSRFLKTGSHTVKLHADGYAGIPYAAIYLRRSGKALFQKRKLSATFACQSQRQSFREQSEQCPACGCQSVH